MPKDIEFTDNFNDVIREMKQHEQDSKRILFISVARDAIAWVGNRAITEYTIKSRGMSLGKSKGMRAPTQKEVPVHPTKFTWRTGRLAKSVMSLFHRTLRESKIRISAKRKMLVAYITIKVPYAWRVEKTRPFLQPAIDDLGNRQLQKIWSNNIDRMKGKWGFR